MTKTQRLANYREQKGRKNEPDEKLGRTGTKNKINYIIINSVDFYYWASSSIFRRNMEL